MTDSNDSRLSPAHPRRRLNKNDYVRINIGQNYWEALVADVQDEKVKEVLSRYCVNIVKMVKSGNGLVISGGRGVGKTMAAVAVLKEAVRRGFTAYFVTHGELCDLQFNDKVFGDGSDGVMVSQKLREAEVLVIDGINEPFFVDKRFGPRHLETAVSQRNARRLTTIITTRAAKEIKKNEDLFDVISERMFPLTINGSNKRDLIRQALFSDVVGE